MDYDLQIEFFRAKSDQIGQVLAVLDEAAAWLQERGVKQWPARFERSWIEDAIRRGDTWLLNLGDKASGTVTLERSDPVWDDAPPAAALYVHRMAVRRSAAGLGAIILDLAADAARQRDLEALRLDCVASNDRLRAYYEAAGFVHRGDATVRGAPGQRRDEGPVTVVSLYEQRLPR